MFISKWWNAPTNQWFMYHATYCPILGCWLTTLLTTAQQCWPNQHSLALSLFWYDCAVQPWSVECFLFVKLWFQSARQCEAGPFLVGTGQKWGRGGSMSKSAMQVLMALSLPPCLCICLLQLRPYCTILSWLANWGILAGATASTSSKVVDCGSFLCCPVLHISIRAQLLQHLLRPPESWISDLIICAIWCSGGCPTLLGGFDIHLPPPLLSR